MVQFVDVHCSLNTPSSCPHFSIFDITPCVDVFYGWSLIIVTVFLSAFYSPGVSTTCCNWTNRPISLQDCVLWPYWFVIFCDLCQIKLNHRYNPFSQRYCTQTPWSSWPILDYTPSNGCSAYCVTTMFFCYFLLSMMHGLMLYYVVTC